MLETAYNRGPFIDSANKRYAYLGAPYCASSASLILDRSKPLSPKVRSGRAKAYIASNSLNARRVWEGKDTIPYNSLVIFTRKGGGHIEFHIETKGDVMRVFGFNTSPDGKSGSQWNGTWSGYKNRSIKKTLSPYNVFRVTHFTQVEYEKPVHPVCRNCGVSRASGSDIVQVSKSVVANYGVFGHGGSRAPYHSPARHCIR